MEAAIQKLSTTKYKGIKTTQVCAYADDIPVAIISRNGRGLEENLIKLDSEAQRRELKTNEGEN